MSCNPPSRHGAGTCREATVFGVSVTGSGAGAFYFDDAIGSSFCLGLFSALLVGSILLFSFTAHTRRVATTGLRGPTTGVTRGIAARAWIAGLTKNPALAIQITRDSDTRLSGEIKIANPGRSAMIVTAINVMQPAGSQVAVAKHAAVTIDFASERAAMDVEIAPGRSAVQRFFVLLPSAGPIGRRLKLQLTLALDPTARETVNRAISAAIPR